MSITDKVCNRCGVCKPVSAFSLDRAKKDGFRTLCRACSSETKKTPEAKVRQAAYMRDVRTQEKWKLYYANCSKAWRKTEKGKAYSKVVTKMMAEKHPLKYGARMEVSKALIQGKLQKLPCFCCGEMKVEAHHADYNRPLDVIWLCNKHHNEIHHAKT